MTLIHDLAKALGGTVDEISALPDGSGFATMSMPLPSDHWLTAEGFDPSPMPMRIGIGPERNRLAEQVRLAARYAIRGATMNGKEKDFDPDAMVQNFVIGLLGYWTEDGTSSDLCANHAPLHDA